MMTKQTTMSAGISAAQDPHRVGINAAVRLRWDSEKIVTAFMSALRDANLVAEQQAIGEALVLLGYEEYIDGWRMEGDL